MQNGKLSSLQPKQRYGQLNNKLLQQIGNALSNYTTPQHYFPGYIFDLDGTVYLGDALLPTASETLGALRARNLRTIFISNNPTHAREEYAAKLTHLGVPTSMEDI
jgi:ribonucleotide monophosphatase NagD (HAD superfamily)